jgi:hypothetical protein
MNCQIIQERLARSLFGLQGQPPRRLARVFTKTDSDFNLCVPTCPESSRSTLTTARKNECSDLVSLFPLSRSSLRHHRLYTVGERREGRERRSSCSQAAGRAFRTGRELDQTTDWTKQQTGAVDWTKCQVINGTRVCVGVEVQFSARSDLLVVDVIHLRRERAEGRIDISLLIVPGDRLAQFLTDRGPSMADAKRHVSEARAEDLPLILIGVEHDGYGPPLAKQAKRPAGTR